MADSFSRSRINGSRGASVKVWGPGWIDGWSESAVVSGMVAQDDKSNEWNIESAGNIFIQLVGWLALASV